MKKISYLILLAFVLVFYSMTLAFAASAYDISVSLPDGSQYKVGSTVNITGIVTKNGDIFQGSNVSMRVDSKSSASRMYSDMLKSDEKGVYTFSVKIDNEYTPGSYVVTVNASGVSKTIEFSIAGETPTYIYGDVSGDGNVNALDFALMKKYVLGISTDFPGPNWKITGDLNADGAINALDFAILKKYLLGVIEKLPVK